MSVRVNPGALGLYGFGLLLLYLAGMYFGSYLLQLFLIALLFPLLSVTLTALAARRFIFDQSRDPGAPVKGTERLWVLTLDNNSILPLYRVEARFRSSTPLSRAAAVSGGEPSSPERVYRFFMGPRQRIRQEVRVQFPFRGSYTIGLDSLTITDFMHLIRFILPSAPEELTVYPSIHDLEALPLAAVTEEGAPVHRLQEVLPDFTLFSHLREYRPGESLKHIFWKKFASRGIPLIREYDSVLDHSVRIYLDLRLPEGQAGMSPAERLMLEDTSIEVLVALVRSCLLQGIPTFAAAAGSEPIRFYGTRPEQFHDLYSATMGMSFHRTVSPVHVHQATVTGAREAGTTIIISHRPDPEIRAAAEQAAAGNQTVYVIANRAVRAVPRNGVRPGAPVDQGTAGIRGPRTIVVESPQEIGRMFSRWSR